MSELAVWRQLSDEVAAGNLKLRVNREGLDAAVKHVQDYLDAIDALQVVVGQVTHVDGFGGFRIGVELAAKFTEKGGGAESIKQRLTELAAEAKAIQDTLRKAAAAYTEADQQGAHAVNQVGGQI
ncbi:hypothetical protein [Nocardia transvalensis]|uniref:hypothetical protein n=1 Tax=Nocardia transvalensis TaxID=37333 RepID=UPI0018938E90|nr:hypothetical protein [Nocardia transvalensis]MBF6333611.1 hypothetical protein [Nocardia transvalensis]